MESPAEILMGYCRAMQNRDIDSCVTLKAFQLEAQTIFENRAKKHPNEVITPDLVQQLVDILEAGYRQERQSNGSQDLSDASFSVIGTELLSSERAIVTQRTTWLDGAIIDERVMLGKTKDGWRVMQAWKPEPNHQIQTIAAKRGSV